MPQTKISQFALNNGLSEAEVRHGVMNGDYFCSFHNGSFVIHTHPDGRLKQFPIRVRRWVYFIHDEWRDATKIGATATIPSRMYQLQVGNPCELKALAFFQYSDKNIATIVEHLAKKHSDRKRILGEWFHGRLDPAEIIDSVTSEYVFGKKNETARIVFDEPKTHAEFFDLFN